MRRFNARQISGGSLSFRSDRIFRRIPPYSLAGGLFFLALFAGSVPAASYHPSSDSAVKAEYLINLLKFVDWQKNGEGDLIICVMGKNPFESQRKLFEKRSIKGRKVALNPFDNLKRTACKIVFISSSEAGKISEIADGLSRSGVLTIGDTSGFAARGVIINFVTENRKIKFEINPEAAEASGIRISSKLLNLATIVHSETP
jgi:hypothetical protein